MSFGYSVSDFIAVVELTYNVRLGLAFPLSRDKS